MRRIHVIILLTVLGAVQAPTLARNGNSELARGNKLALHEKYQDAIAAFDAAITADPKLAQAYSHRAAALVKLGKYDSALADCTKAIRLDRKNVRALVLRGLIYKQLGKHNKELRDLRTAKKLIACP